MLKRLSLSFYSALSLWILIGMVGELDKAGDFKTWGSLLLTTQVLLFGILFSVIVLILLILIFKNVWLTEKAVRTGATTTFVFLLFAVIMGIIRSYPIYYFVDALIYSGVLGVIAGLFVYREDFSFVTDHSIKESTKERRLNQIDGLIKQGLTLFTSLYFAGLIGSAIPFVTKIIKDGSAVALISVVTVLVWLTAGVIAGVYIRLFRISQEVKEYCTLF